VLEVVILVLSIHVITSSLIMLTLQCLKSQMFNVLVIKVKLHLNIVIYCLIPKHFFPAFNNSTLIK